MYYELYVDTLFIINFIMNLCLLYLTDKSIGCTATRRRIVLGGGMGALCFLLPFFCRGQIWLRVLLGAAAGITAMIFPVFRVKSVRAFFTVAGGLVKYTFLLGGGILFINNIISRFGIEANALITAVSGIMLTCILAFGIERKRHGHICRAVLIRNGKSITVRALIDSGNSLVEPISGKAVSVLDTKLFNELYDGDEAFRAVPFHSVGRAHGLLKGYFIDELKVERNGIQKSYGNVCVAVGADEVFGDGGRSIGLIINPEIFRA